MARTPPKQVHITSSSCARYNGARIVVFLWSRGPAAPLASRYHVTHHPDAGSLVRTCIEKKRIPHRDGSMDFPSGTVSNLELNHQWHIAHLDANKHVRSTTLARHFSHPSARKHLYKVQEWRLFHAFQPSGPSTVNHQ